MTDKFIPVEKDEDNERKIPDIWRPIFTQIVNSFVEGDYALSEGIDFVSLITDETSSQIKDYIEDYGETLIQLPNVAWESSIYIWMGTYWDILIDLWTEEEGRSDLVLKAKATENGKEYVIEVEMVYVP